MYPMIFTGIVIVIMTILLIIELYRPAIIIFTAVFILYLGGIINLKEFFIGFSNQGMLTVAFLFIVAAALQGSNAFSIIISKLFGKGDSIFRYFRLMLPVSALSAFLNNTPIVAALIPSVKKWSKKNNIPASKYLIPLSYAAIFGGLCTLIGTSTNLVIHGMMLEDGLKGFTFFELGKIGLPLTLFGTFYFAFGGHRLLPIRKEPIVEFGSHLREFVVALKVTSQYPNIGKTIEEAGLRHLKGLYLFQICREGQYLVPIAPNEVIKLNDRLFFTGLPDTIYELQKTTGLSLVKDIEFDFKNYDSDKLSTFEAVISNSSPLIGQSVRESNFRKKYDAVILGIHRSGERINKKVGDIIFQSNDTLFLLGKKDFEKKWYHSRDFSLVTTSINEYSKPEKKANIALLILILMIIIGAIGIAKMLVVAAGAALMMLILRIISFYDAKKAIDFEVLIVIACAFALGKAMFNSGIADFIAGNLISILQPFGIIGIIAGLFLLTSIYTELITNNAAAALMFPVALSTAQKIRIDPHPLMITIAIAASSSFATPLGYQTNLMVYNPGGYKFKDFLKTGIPVNIGAWLITTFLVYIFYYA